MGNLIKGPFPDSFDMADMRDIRDEDEIIWVEDPRQFTYVRQMFISIPNRTRRPSKSSFARTTWLIGYATLLPAAKSGRPNRFSRRVFVVRNYDPYENGGCPCEAVDPMTVKPRRLAQKPKIEDL